MKYTIDKIITTMTKQESINKLSEIVEDFNKFETTYTIKKKIAIYETISNFNHAIKMLGEDKGLVEFAKKGYAY